MNLPSPGLVGIVFLISEVALAVAKRSRVAGSSRDANSLRLLWIVIGISIWLGVVAVWRYPQFALPHRQEFAVAGFVLFVIALLLRWFAIIHLGRFFTVNVAIAADHELVETGPYRFVRHPSYTGSLLAFLGFALMLGNALTVAIIMVPVTLVFVHRMNVEERALIGALGEKYVGYRARTKRLLPFVY